jgi:enamine deaminase RidA (YjgF/YER057c/UK114 family)
MAKIEQRLEALGLVLPEPLRLPEGVRLPFAWVNVRGDVAFVSGHGPQEADGATAEPFGAVGLEVTVEQAQVAARKTALSMLGSLKRELGDLDRITSWRRVHGMVNCAPGFSQTTAVINGFSDLIVEVFGPDIGRHARTAVGVAGLPHNIPVEIEAEVGISGA